MLKAFHRIAAGALLSAALLAFGPGAALASVDDGVAQLKAGKYAEAMKSFKAEAGKDNGEAMYYIGSMLGQGLGQKRAPLEATYWWKKGAFLGNEKCLLAISEAYRTGFGVRVEPRQALVWDREGAKAGSIVALKNLGDYYAQGNGVERDPAEAAKWYVHAARAGLPEGEAALAGLLRAGEGVQKDPVAALALLESAAHPENGREAARGAAADARNLSHELSEPDVARAKSMKTADIVEKLTKELGISEKLF